MAHDLSLRLSRVLDEIGVNERVVMKRRRLLLLKESFNTLAQKVLENDMDVYLFGSQTEGTTTLGLNSDQDLLSTDNRYNVIQDWEDWEPGKRNLLMITDDETVTPGYCLLQELRYDAPMPENTEADQHSYTDRLGRILLKNTFINIGACSEAVVHGPAQSVEGILGFVDTDYVAALPCKTWPLEASQWIDHLDGRQWPTEDMKLYCKNTGFFVVGAGQKGSANEQLEWRISSSLAERCLMFNLNITQIRCYVLMKMILKTFVTVQAPDSISSFMCKTVLLHCVSNSKIIAWNEDNSVNCLIFCLSTLYRCVLDESCPHFLIRDNNLMRQRFSPAAKQIILEILRKIIGSNGTALLEIGCDQLGLRIQNSFFSFQEINSEHQSCLISGQLVKSVAMAINSTYIFLLEKTNKDDRIYKVLQKLSKYMINVFHRYMVNQGQDQGQVANCILVRQLSITLGSIIASTNMNSRNSVIRHSLRWMLLGLDIDVASGKLKLASIFYCLGDFERTEQLLRNINESYDPNLVEPVCICYECHQIYNPAFGKLCYESNNEYTSLKCLTASCVRFLRGEINCCPRELQHEMFRSTQEDLHHRTEDDMWMDWAVIDCLPFLYFLQFKIYSHLQRQEEKQRALLKFANCIRQEANLGHRETALNILGQCMEQENDIDSAFNCFLLSLKIRERNNAARFHSCRLLSSLVGNQM